MTVQAPEIVVDLQERELTLAEKRQLDEYAEVALRLLHFRGHHDDPFDIVCAISAYITEWQDNDSHWLDPLPGQPDLMTTALGLGILWADQVVRVFDWEWVCLSQDHRSFFAIVSPDRAYAIYPTYGMRQFLEDSFKQNTTQRLYNQIRTRYLPVSQRGYYAKLTF